MNVEDNINPEMEKTQNFKEQIAQSFVRYQKILNIMALDAPISILMLPKAIEKAVLNSGYTRIYEIANLDFVKIEGLDDVQKVRLTACLNQFLSMM